jgi:sensor histidine kinase YesM
MILTPGVIKVPPLILQPFAENAILAWFNAKRKAAVIC